MVDEGCSHVQISHGKGVQFDAIRKFQCGEIFSGSAQQCLMLKRELFCWIDDVEAPPPLTVNYIGLGNLIIPTYPIKYSEASSPS